MRRLVVVQLAMFAVIAAVVIPFGIRFVAGPAETAVPGAFLMWLGFAAGVMFLLVLFIPGMPLLLQAILWSQPYVIEGDF